jgi:manganese/zinc/iron transport system substrate-binding protein
MTRNSLAGLLFLLLAVPLLAACGAVASGSQRDAAPLAPIEGIEQRTVRVTTTTNLVTDLARVIGGDRVEVTGLMGPGVDPHLYKASAGDVKRLGEADLMLYGGLQLEGKMGDVLDELGARRPAVAVTRSLPHDRLRADPGAEGHPDPHVWFDPTLWAMAADEVAATLAAIDPSSAGAYAQRAAAFKDELAALDAETRAAVQAIPAEQRVIVTSHDAFGYLGARYGLDVVAIQGISTQSEATTGDIERVAAVVAERGLRSVFIESSVPRQTIDAVLAAARARGQEASVGEPLYSDSAGDPDTPEGTYLGMFRHNVRAIVEGLR